MKNRFKALILTLALLLVSLPFLSCGFLGDPMLDDLWTRNIYPGSNSTYVIGSSNYTYLGGWFYDLFVRNTVTVGGNDPPITPRSGGAYFDGAIAVRTEHQGFGIVAIGRNANVPLHTGTGSFDLTGGAYENLFTSTTPIFEVEDMELSNWIVISSGDYIGRVAEIITFIDASNVALHTMNWDSDLTDVTFAVVRHPIFASSAAGHVHIDGKGTGDTHIHSDNHTADCLVLVELEAGTDDISAVCVEVDANGYSDVAGIDVDYETGDLQVGDHAHIIRVSADETGATSSNATTEIDFIEILTTDTEDLLKHAIHIGQSFDSALTVSGGTEEDPDHGYEVTPDVPVDRVTGVAPDGTAFLEASASDLTIFDADNDYILIGSDAIFEAIDAVLVNGANQPINEEYYYSTGAGTWATLVTSNTVNGFTQSGTITFNAPATWATSNVTQPTGAGITNAFYVKIVRTRNNLGQPPVEDYFKTFTSSSTTDFEIRGDGTIRPVEMADAAAPNNSIYFSTDSNILVYKDGSGVVHDLW